MADIAATTTKDASETGRHGSVVIVEPDSFEPESHFYPRVLNSTIHPLVRTFMTMDTMRIVKRYCHLNPAVPAEALTERLMYKPAFFRWSGCDTFMTTSGDGVRRTVVVETNSCPSGQKSTPTLGDDDADAGGYRALLDNTFSAYIKQEDCEVDGCLAVVYDKNLMEASGYAATLADIASERVYLAEFYATDADPPVKFDDGVMYIRHEDAWLPVRACFRYVTQRPWNRIPLSTKTRILNPIVACLAGGRNKLLAGKAYDMYNGELSAQGNGLHIEVPETICDVGLAEVPLWVKSFGGHAVVKVPYSNAGQGVYTILCPADLEAFMAMEHPYEKFIVQALIGNAKWSDASKRSSLRCHIGTIPDRRGDIFVTDIRMMVAATPTGFRPIAVYARRANKPLTDTVPTAAGDAWEMLGTNLSKKLAADSFTTETGRLLLMDRKDFNKLGIGIDDLIEAFVQTVLATTAIDKMCMRLMGGRGGNEFNMELFRSLNDDPTLVDELIPGTTSPEKPTAGAGSA